MQLLDKMKVVFERTGRAFIIFGDSAFPLSRFMQRMLKGNMDKAGECFNALMSRLRICIENVFAEVFQFWGYTSHHLQHKLGCELVHETFLVATFLQNCKACFHGNQMSAQYGYDALAQMPLSRFLTMRHVPHYGGCV